MAIAGAYVLAEENSKGILTFEWRCSGISAA
jgi:hypothetical protein